MKYNETIILGHQLSYINIYLKHYFAMLVKNRKSKKLSYHATKRKGYRQHG